MPTFAEDMNELNIPMSHDSSQTASIIRGFLAIPIDAKAIIIFAHGSGSGKSSARNQYVVKVLNEAGFATALFDLLSEEEAKEDEKTKKLRFNIPYCQIGLQELLIG